MVSNDFDAITERPAGYTALINGYGFEVIPNWHQSYVSMTGIRRVEKAEGSVVDIYPATYWPGNATADHLEFALKYDGTNLAILAAIFNKMPEADLVEFVRAKPTGKYARRLWFLYEFLTGKTLALEDLKQGSYVDLLEPEKYHTIAVPRRVSRYRVNDNLLGNVQFCPMVRRTQVIRDYEAADLADRCRRVMSAYPTELLGRALSYLYTKETKSSFEIEHIRPNSSRIERFVAMLQLAEQDDFCNRERLTLLQNSIVDPRFKAGDYRSSQNYVGESVAWGKERIHFVSPKPGDLSELMKGLESAHRQMGERGSSPVIHAAVVAYGFVFLHPFDDGNGRIHRFLIHNILARRGFAPKTIMFPVSAAMLKDPARYDASLEAFSRPLLGLVDYVLDEQGAMTVKNDTATWYRYMDMTAQVEALFEFIERTIEDELASELSFLVNYDNARRAIQEILDMPDRSIDLFIRFCLQNSYRISASKRTDHFEFLSDAEVAQMEAAVYSAYGSQNPVE